MIRTDITFEVLIENDRPYIRCHTEDWKYVSEHCDTVEEAYQSLLEVIRDESST